MVTSPLKLVWHAFHLCGIHHDQVVFDIDNIEIYGCEPFFIADI